MRRHADRIWLVAGAAVIALLALACWFLLIHPKNVERHEVERQTEDTQSQVVVLRSRISELKRQQANLTTLQAALKKKQTALPSDTGIPVFLNQLQKAGSDTSVAVTGVSVGAASQLTDPAGVWALPITLTAEGSLANLERFLIALQTGHARALLIENASVASESGAAATTNTTGTNTTASYVTADDPGSGTTRDNTPSTSTPDTNTPSTGTPSTTAPSTGTPSTTTPSTGTPSTNTPADNTPSTGTTTGAVSINLTLKAFVAPAADAGAPTTTTK